MAAAPALRAAEQPRDIATPEKHGPGSIFTVCHAFPAEIGAAGGSGSAGLSPVPHAVAQWRREHRGQDIPDGHIFTQPWPAGLTAKRRDLVIYY